MDIIGILTANENIIVLILAVLAGVIQQYYSQQASVLYAAGQALIDLEQTMMGDIADGVITQQELTVLLQKIQTAETDLKAVITLFTQPQTTTQKLSILFRTTGAKEVIKRLNQKTAMMAKLKKAQMNKPFVIPKK
jgi:hypothetical protein